MKLTKNINTGDEELVFRTISTSPKEHFEGRWKSGRLYPLYSVVVNNGTTFVSQNAKMKEEPYVIYDAVKQEFKANDGWKIKEMSADSRLTALGGGSAGGGVTPEDVAEMISGKQDTIEDLSAIRSGASAGATAYQKPNSGIPASDIASGVIPTDVVKYSLQTLTDAQKAEARANIEAQDYLVSGTNIKTVNGESILGSGNIAAGDPNAVKYTEQTLTDAQKTQSRTNIGAGTYSKPSGGIPASDIASGVIPTVPTVSTDVSADAASDVKTSSPKSVKTYVDAGIAAVESDLSDLADEVEAIDIGAYDVAWDGNSEPVVANIPAGVSVTYNTTTYTGTLAASASTIQKIYLVATGTTDNYDRYVTVGDSTYSWVNIGTTEITLADYATKTKVSQLEAEVTDLDGRTEKIEDVIPGDSVSYTGKIVTLENISSLPTVSGSNDYIFSGKNLFDVSTRVFGKIKNDSGVETDDATSTYFSGYIPVYGGVKISSSITIQRIYLYTPNKEWIGRYGNNLTTFDVPATHNDQTVGWMQIQMANANVSDTMMVNYGANPLTFEAYKSNAGTEYYSDYMLVYDNLLADIVVTVGAYANLQAELVSGENIKTVNGESILGSGNIDINFDVGMEDIVLSGNIIVLENTLTDAELPASANVVGRNLVDGSSQVFKKIKNDSGTEVSDPTSSYYTTFIPAIGGTTLSANVNLQRIYYYDVNKNWIGRSSGATDSKTREVPAIVSNTAVGWVQVQIPHGELPQEGLMVNYGGTAFAYEAYKTNNTPVLYPGYSVVFANDLSTITISGKSLFMMALPQISIPEVWEPSWVESGYSSPIGSQKTIRANWTAPNKYLYYDFLAYYYDAYIGGSYADKYKVTKRSLGNDCSNLGYEMFEYDFCPANYTKVVLLSAGMNTNETSGIWGVATFVRELMNPAEQTMRWLHDNVRFIVLPIICPSSFDQTPLKYENYNGVRVNKNFNYKDSWNYIHNNYTNQKEGSYPDSEAETLNLKRWINKYSGIADFYIDCHSDDDSRGENYNTILTQVICSDSVIKSKIDATFPALVAFYTAKGYIPEGTTAKTQSWVEGGTIYPKTVYAKNFCQIPSIMIEQYICSTMYGSDGQTNNDTYGIKNYCAMLRMYVMAALVQNATAVPTGVIPMNGYRVNYK